MAVDHDEKPINPVLVGSLSESVSTIDDPIEPLTATFMPDDVFDGMMIEANQSPIQSPIDIGQEIAELGDELIGMMFSTSNNPLFDPNSSPTDIVPDSPNTFLNHSYSPVPQMVGIGSGHKS